MMKRSPSRRRFLAISAAAGASLTLGGASHATAARYAWRGSAMGAEAKLSVIADNGAQARRLVELTLGEIARLERCFSLYRSDSELARLNATGRLDRPSGDFRIVLAHALACWQRSEGAFNPAVQPLWSVLAQHFAQNHGGGEPDAQALERARTLADPSRIAASAAAITLTPGMALTFNGIAQGYVTDQVSELLAAEGCHDALVQTGELRALPGGAWDVAVAPTGLALTLKGAALATSEPAGTPLSADGRWHHLLDPHTGRSSHGVASVSVKAPRATDADALSTALAVADPASWARILARYPTAGALVRHSDGATEALGQAL